MADKDLGNELEKFEEGIENLKNKEFRLFGIKMTPMTISALIAGIDDTNDYLSSYRRDWFYRWCVIWWLPHVSES